MKLINCFEQKEKEKQPVLVFLYVKKTGSFVQFSWTVNNCNKQKTAWVWMQCIAFLHSSSSVSVPVNFGTHLLKNSVKTTATTKQQFLFLFPTQLCMHVFGKHLPTHFILFILFSWFYLAALPSSLPGDLHRGIVH